MADDSASPDDRTEEPTPRRLLQAEQEGQLAISRDAVQLVSLVAGLLCLAAVIGPLSTSLVRAVAASTHAAARGDAQGLLAALGPPMGLALLVGAAAALASSGLTLAQTRGRLWPNLLAPDPKRLFSPKRVLRFLEREGIEDLLIAVVRVALVGTVVVLALRDDFLALSRLLLLPPVEIVAQLGRLAAKSAAITLACLAVFGVLDVFVSRHRFFKKLRMTRDELKRDHKEEDGDPLIKSRRRKKHRELAQGRVAVEVPRADAIVVNPTHIAIALRYRQGKDKAPRVTAKGKGEAAEVIRELARNHAIPIVEDIPLARLLHKRVKVGGEVPAETYRAVAAVLAFAYRVRGRGGSRT